MNDAPPENKKPEPKSSFAAQVVIALVIVAGVFLLNLKAKDATIFKLSGLLIPMLGVSLCLSPRTRGYGVGLLLGFAFAGIALAGMCFSALSHI
jgi:hypothetical protein